MRKIILFITLAFSTVSLTAQEYLYEIGPTGGAAFYSGDANNYSLFSKPGYSYGLSVRRNFNLRTALKIDLMQAAVSENTADYKNVFPSQTNYSFTTKFTDINAHLEYSFFSYSDRFEYKETRKFSPYIFAGIGVTFVNSPASMTRLNIPMGVGVKYKIAHRINIGAEWSMNMLMSDRFDMIESGAGVSFPLADPYAIDKSSGVKNNDWYSYLKFYITFDFYQPSCKCNKN